MSNLDPSQLLQAEAAGLAVDDILALCYSFGQKGGAHEARLRLYLDVLRKRGGERAQFASCLLCYDLARQGDASAQREFVYLADTIRGLAQKVELVDALIASDPYLVYVWELCQAQLEDMDPRFVEPEQADQIAAINLLTDDDFDQEPGGFSIEVDDTALWMRFDRAVEDFLGGQLGVPVYDMDAGFRVKNNRDVERIEHFLLELDSVREFVSPARGFRALTLLFYGTHLRSKSLFGAKNERKQQLLQAGIAEYFASAGEVAQIVGVLGPMHAEPEVWEKISDVVLDYVTLCADVPDVLAQGPGSYDAVGRLVQRDAARGMFRK